MNTLDAIRQPVKRDLALFEQFIVEHFKAEGAFLSEMLDYALSTRGKSIRPTLVLLAAHLVAPDTRLTDRSYLSAALVEMVHVSSLIHDDVIDESAQRRGRASVNARWQSHNAVVLGDYIMIQNMNIGLESGHNDILKYISRSITTLCEGELLQSDHSRKMDTTRQDYLDIIFRKTASLMGISARVGAMSVGADTAQIELMQHFGEQIGMAFQIQDDILDYAHDVQLGKPSNNDLRERKITLPLLEILERSTPSRRRELLVRFATCDKNEASVDYVRRVVEQEGGLEEAAKSVRAYLDGAKAMIASYPDTPYRHSLMTLCDYVAERSI